MAVRPNVAPTVGKVLTADDWIVAGTENDIDNPYVPGDGRDGQG
jgi:hypothetical protein